MGRLPYDVVTSADPAANAEHAYTVTRDSKLISFVSNFVTDANAGNRQVRLTIEDAAGAVYFQTVAPDVQVASKTGIYVSGPGAVASETIETNTILHQMYLPPEGIYVPLNGIIKTITFNIQATDNWGTMKFLFERE